MMRTAELAGTLGAYDPDLVARAVRQTAAGAPPLTYLLLPDEALRLLGVDAVGADVLGPLTFDTARQVERCLVPWRFEAMQMVAYCLLDEGHEADTTGLAHGLAAADVPPWGIVEHGWYRLIDGIERGEAEVDGAVARIEARAAAGRRHRPPPPLR